MVWTSEGLRQSMTTQVFLTALLILMFSIPCSPGKPWFIKNSRISLSSRGLGKFLTVIPLKCSMSLVVGSGRLIDEGNLVSLITGASFSACLTSSSVLSSYSSSNVVRTNFISSQSFFICSKKNTFSPPPIAQFLATASPGHSLAIF